ncbi:RNA pseudouridine synthase [Lewinellaceae bacterium SD302]|nr:RNA pseudouridine synthase [Lewinellaceae bacterium SD302]
MPKQEKEAPRFKGRISDWVLYNNHQLIAFNKPAGLSVQPDRSGDLALSQMGAAYTRTDLQAVNRLDRPVSGVVLMAKKARAQKQVGKQFEAGSVEKVYLAIVGERPPKDEDTLVNFLREKNHKNNKTEVAAEEGPDTRRAELHYKYLASGERYHLLEIRPKTGRKHQIRVQLAHLGCPLRGDTKYGFKRSNEGGVIDLHSWKLTFAHPVSGEAVELKAELPEGAVWEIAKEL